MWANDEQVFASEVKATDLFAILYFWIGLYPILARCIASLDMVYLETLRWTLASCESPTPSFNRGRQKSYPHFQFCTSDILPNVLCNSVFNDAIQAELSGYWSHLQRCWQAPHVYGMIRLTSSFVRVFNSTLLVLNASIFFSCREADDFGWQYSVDYLPHSTHWNSVWHRM